MLTQPLGRHLASPSASTPVAAIPWCRASCPAQPVPLAQHMHSAWTEQERDATKQHKVIHQLLAHLGSSEGLRALVCRGGCWVLWGEGVSTVCQLVQSRRSTKEQVAAKVDKGGKRSVGRCVSKVVVQGGRKLLGPPRLEEQRCGQAAAHALPAPTAGRVVHNTGGGRTAAAKRDLCAGWEKLGTDSTALGRRGGQWGCKDRDRKTRRLVH